MQRSGNTWEQLLGCMPLKLVPLSTFGMWWKKRFESLMCGRIVGCYNNSMGLNFERVLPEHRQRRFEVILKTKGYPTSY